MIHYTCDLCGQPVGDDRYSVNIEIVAADEDPDPASDVDHLEALEDELTGDDDGDPHLHGQQIHFDLCPKCCKRYSSNPLPMTHIQRMKFSEN